MKWKANEVYFRKKEWDYYKDQLTGLDNRFALLEYIKLNSRLNVFVVNVDNFSSINGAYGYVVADQLLVKIANYLK
ncbi:MAG: diguanylate cyclase, partial [Epsilonproteobacteria bacterium]|nr:diguanylate cyclase [Campylobacterota bacterium]